MFNQNSANVRFKNQARVHVRVDGDEPFEGIVFLVVGDRLIDLLNDERAFIPIKRLDGETVILAKSKIVSIIEDADTVASDNDGDHPAASSQQAKEEAPIDETKISIRKASAFDPYAILRVPPEADIDEIRAAYKTRMKAVHPDSIASLGLDDDLIDAALKTTQKLNYAYRRILRDLEEKSQEDQTVEKTA